MNRKFKSGISLFVIGTLVTLLGCKKLTQVPEPANTITTTETFSSEATATSAILGIYNDLLTNQGGSNGNTQLGYGNGFTSLAMGMSADELHMMYGPSVFETNTVTAKNGSFYFWNAPYYNIYLTNAAIEGLSNSQTIPEATKDQLMGEAKFFRAFDHFYLVNAYGDVPCLTTTTYAINDTMRRTPMSLVYQQIIKDLNDAQNLLAADYSVSNNERVRVNKFGATALLARAYLYTGEWAKAEERSSAVINNTGLYALEADLNSVFLKESREAILQLQTFNNYPYATFEGYNVLPPDAVDPPNYYLTDQLLNDFEAGDLRKQAWVDSINYSGTEYYYPYKYKVFVGTSNNIDEYYTLLRLAEQFLIRAEARAKQSNLAGAIADLDTLRERAGLPDLSPNLTQDQVLAAVAQERRIELFAEWGHRWMDLKRTGQADAVLRPIKQYWKSTDTVYAIPAGELIDDANLVQNPGY